MKNGDLKVVRFNESDVIATSGNELGISFQYTYNSFTKVKTSGMYDAGTENLITTGTIAGAAYNGAISYTNGILSIGTTEIDTQDEADALTGYYTYKDGTYTWSRGLTQ